MHRDELELYSNSRVLEAYMPVKRMRHLLVRHSSPDRRGGDSVGDASSAQK
jgi:hypothetical protein